MYFCNRFFRHATFLDEIALFSSTYVFTRFSPSNAQVERPNWVIDCLIWQNSICIPKYVRQNVADRCDCLFSWLPILPSSVVVNPNFNHSYIRTQQVHSIWQKQLQTAQNYWQVVVSSPRWANATPIAKIAFSWTHIYGKWNRHVPFFHLKCQLSPTTLV